MGEDADRRVAQAIGALQRLVGEESFLASRGRFLSCEMLLEAGTQPYFLRLRGGNLTEIARGPILMRSWDFALRADADAWLAHWEPVPRPGFHDIFAMAKQGRLRMEGDLHPLMANLQFIKDLLVLPRRLAERATA